MTNLTTLNLGHQPARELGTATAQFRMPHQLCVASRGNVRVAEVTNNRIQKFIAKNEDPYPNSGSGLPSSSKLSGRLSRLRNACSFGMPKAW